MTGSPPCPSRPKIHLGVDIAAELEQSIAALAAFDEVFQQEGRLVHIREGQIRRMTRNSIVVSLAYCAAFVRHKKQPNGDWKEIPAQPTTPLAERIRDWGKYEGVRPIVAVTTTPVLRSDGSILSEPGYDPETKLFYEPKGGLPTIPTDPTLTHAKCAVKDLLDVVDEVPFARPVDRSSWLSLILTLVSKSLLTENAPLFAAIGNQRRVGKTRLIAYAELIALGSDRGATRWPNERNSDEVGKKVDSAIRDQIPLFTWDNVDREINGTALEAALTSPMWTMRELGMTGVKTVRQNTVFAVTAHGVSFGGDMSARTLPIRLFYDKPNPGSRTFRRPNLKRHIHENQHKLHAAALTIMSAFMRAGAPDQGLETWGSYEGWSELIRNALVWVGQPDPLEARKGLEQEDQGDQVFEQLVDFIVKMMPAFSGDWTVGMLADCFGDGMVATETLGAGWTVQDARDLAAALDVWDGKSRSVNRRKLGLRVRGYIDRPNAKGQRITYARTPHGRPRKHRTNVAMYTVVS